VVLEESLYIHNIRDMKVIEKILYNIQLFFKCFIILICRIYD